MSKHCTAKLASGIGLVVIVVLLALAVFPAFAGDYSQAVELRCKIVPPAAGMPDQWRIRLEKSTGEPVGVAAAMSGDTVHFKHLQPDIYVVCLDGTQGRHSCQSVDLIPPADHKDHSFLKKLMTPVFRRSQHRISASRYSIPKEATEELGRSEEAQLRGDYDGMLEHLNNALKIYPQYADALNNLGVYYRREKNYQLSLQYFTQVTELQPDYYGGWLNLGSTLLAMGQFRKALDANLEALELLPDDAMVNSQVALGYYYLRQYVEAKRYFEKVAELDPYFANSPYLYLAHIALAERRDRDAEECFREFLKLHPNSPEAPRLTKTVAALASGTIIRAPETKGPEVSKVAHGTP